jgi:hypothetical protein
MAGISPRGARKREGSATLLGRVSTKTGRRRCGGAVALKGGSIGSSVHQCFGAQLITAIAWGWRGSKWVLSGGDMGRQGRAMAAGGARWG